MPRRRVSNCTIWEGSTNSIVLQAVHDDVPHRMAVSARWELMSRPFGAAFVPAGPPALRSEAARITRAKATLGTSVNAIVRTPTIQAFHADKDPAKANTNGDASNHAPTPALITSAVCGPDTSGTRHVATTRQTLTTQAFAEAFAEITVFPRSPKAHGTANKYTPSNAVAHLRHPLKDAFMPDTLDRRRPSRRRRGRRPPDPCLEQLFGLALELAHSLPRELQLGGEFGKRRWLVVVEAVAPQQHVAGLLRQTFYRLPEPRRLHLSYDDGVRGVGCLLPGEEVPEARSPVPVRCRLIEARGVRDDRLHLPHLIGGPVQPLGELLIGRRPPELGREVSGGASNLP